MRRSGSPQDEAGELVTPVAEVGVGTLPYSSSAMNAASVPRANDVVSFLRLRRCGVDVLNIPRDWGSKRLFAYVSSLPDVVCSMPLSERMGCCAVLLGSDAQLAPQTGVYDKNSRRLLRAFATIRCTPVHGKTSPTLFITACSSTHSVLLASFRRTLSCSPLLAVVFRAIPPREDVLDDSSCGPAVVTSSLSNSTALRVQSWGSTMVAAPVNIRRIWTITLVW